MKKLAMLLVICLLATALPCAALSETVGNALAEGAGDGDLVESAAVDAPVGEAVGEIGGSGLFAEPEGDAPDEGYHDEYPLPDPMAEQEDQFPLEGESAASSEAMMALEGESFAFDDALFAVQPPLPDATDPMVGAPELAVAPPHTDPNGPQLAANDVRLGVGESFALIPLNPQAPSAAVGSILFSSPNPAVAAVTPEGIVQAVSPGDVRLTATSIDGTYAECDVHVRFAPEAVSFNMASIEIGKGETTDALKVTLGSAAGECAGAYSFHSSTPKIVAVDENGVIRGLKRGNAVINVTTYNGLSASCTVTVLKAPKKLTMAEKSAVMGVGEWRQIMVQLPRKSASRLVYASEVPEIVAVDPVTGAMQALAVGTTRVAARSFNGKVAVMSVTVLPAPQTLSFGGSEFIMGVGMSTDAAASVEPGAAPSVTYTIGNPGIAAFRDGKLYALNAGETDIVAATYNGLSAACKLIVKPAPQYVRLPYATLNIGLGESIRLQPDVGDSAGTFTFKSSSSKKVSVSPDGVVTGRRKGKATVTITTYNKKRFKLKVVVQNEPTIVALAIWPTGLELGVGEGAQLTSNLPGTTYASENPAIVQVDALNGNVFAASPGVTQIVATSPDGQRATCAVTVCGMPEWVTTDVDMIELSQGQTWALNVALSPGSRSALRFTSMNPAVATVSETGVITGVASGRTEIIVQTAVEGVTAQVIVTVIAAPQSLSLAVTEMTLNVQETCQMQPIIPEGTVTTFSYASSDERVATVSQDGAVLALSRGTAVLGVKTSNGLTAFMTLTVLDPWYPESAELVNAPGVLTIGDTVQLSYALLPESAVADFEWASSNPEVVSVSGDGLLQANAMGYARIYAQSRRNAAVTLELTVAVQTTGLTLTIPARITDVAGIPTNLAKIDAIRVCAIGQIDAMRAGGVISDSDASKRRSMVNNAFADYAFPWMTPAYQDYWKAANSEGGVKDFKPGQVYYGLPYISGSGNNRLYNASRALSEGRYTDSGMGYYLLNQGNLLKGKYCGNDCSGFVNAAIWGTNSSHSADRTTEIAKVSAYRTIKDYGALRTGDLICKSSAHVVMFLYYASADKSQIMVIENGGVEPGTNTVHCIVMDVGYYISNGYSPRRLASLG